MTEIKFRYRLKGFHNKKTFTRIFTIEEIESHDFSSWHENYEVLSRDRFTELKDKNGKEVYHKDIVSNGISNYVVVWSDNAWKIQRGVALYYIGVELIDLEVIGNVKENPELLK